MARRPAPAPLGPALGGMIDETSYRIILPELSDRELLQYDIAINNPLELSPRSEEAPQLNQELSFIGEYQLENKVKCVFGHPHMHGFVFRDEHGVHYLIGNECGAKLMGAAMWQEFKGRTEATKDRASYLRQLEALRAAFTRHRNWIAGLGRSKELAAFTTARAELRALPDLVKACARVLIQEGGQLTKLVRVRNFAAEAAREDRYDRELADYNSKTETEKTHLDKRGYKPTLSKTPILREERQNAGILTGAALFASRVPSAHSVSEMVKLIDAFIALERIPQDKKQVKRMSENARAVIGGILSIRSAIDEAIDFYEPQNVRMLIEWANEKKISRLIYSAVPAGFLASDGQGERNDILILRPAGLSKLSDPRFDELVNAGQAFAREFEPAARAA